MRFKPEAFKTQLESLRILRRELAIKEKELADQKWVFERFLKSPTWRFTYPIRWAANQIRGFRKAVTGKSHNSSEDSIQSAPSDDDFSGIGMDYGLNLKSSFAFQYRIWFENFLVSGAKLELPHSNAPTVSVLLVLFNRVELTFACLRSIAECRSEEIEVIIVDNASSDGTSKLLDRLCGARIIRNKENLNFLLAVNQAAREAKGEHILLLNNDAQLLPGTVANALRTLTSSSGIGAVGGKIVLLDGTLQEAGSIVWHDGSCLGYGRGDEPLAPAYMFRRDVDYCSGAFLLTPRRVWEELGGFDEAFRPAYYEEADYCMRLWERGLRVVYEPDAVIVHYEFGSSVSSSRAIQLQRDHQSIFADRHRDSLNNQCSSDLADTLSARSKNADERILFLDDRVPHAWLGSGFPRARTMILSLIKLGFFITVYPLSEANEAWDIVYSDLPREIEIMTGLGSLMLEMFLRNRLDYYAAIVVSRPHNMKILQSMLKSHPDWFEKVHIVYDAEALFTRRDALLQELAGTPWSVRKIQEALDKEIELAAAADCVVSVSERERAAFSECGIQNVHVIGHAIDIAPLPVRFEQRSGLLFVGAIHSEKSPNADSMIWFLTEVFPKIQAQLGGAIRVTIAGMNNSRRIRELAGPCVHIAGRVTDLGELYSNARLFIAPTRYAAGLPHKIHEAAAHGLPVVATPLLATQLAWTERELAIGGDAESFAARCADYYTDPVKWMKLRNAALARVEKDCSPELFDKTVREVVDVLRLS